MTRTQIAAIAKECVERMWSACMRAPIDHEARKRIITDVLVEEFIDAGAVVGADTVAEQRKTDTHEDMDITGSIECAIGVTGDADDMAAALAGFLRHKGLGGYIRTALGFSPSFKEPCLILTTARTADGPNPLPIIGAALTVMGQKCCHMIHNGTGYCLRADGKVRKTGA